MGHSSAIAPPSAKEHQPRSKPKQFGCPICNLARAASMITCWCDWHKQHQLIWLAAPFRVILPQLHPCGLFSQFPLKHWVYHWGLHGPRFYMLTISIPVGKTLVPLPLEQISRKETTPVRVMNTPRGTNHFVHNPWWSAWPGIWRLLSPGSSRKERRGAQIQNSFILQEFKWFQSPE